MGHNDNRLKKCPFCASEDAFTVSVGEPQEFAVCCNNCFAKTRYWPTTNNAVMAWNTRRETKDQPPAAPRPSSRLSHDFG